MVAGRFGRVPLNSNKITNYFSLCYKLIHINILVNIVSNPYEQCGKIIL